MKPDIKKSDIWKLEWAEKECSYVSKIDALRQTLLDNEADYFLVSALDEFSWLFNIRAFDIEYTPVVRGYAIVGRDKIMIFIE